MAKKPRRRATASVEMHATMADQPSLTPDSGFRITLKQALVAVTVILGAGVAYGTIKWDQAETRKDIAEIKKTQDTLTAATPAVIKEQDDKRTKLGEAFLASNEKIAVKVGDLATAVAVQQESARATNAALVKIGEQLDRLVHQLPEKKR